MSQKRIVIISVAVIAAIGAIVAVFLLTCKQPIGNISNSCSQPETSVSDISFSGTQGGKIKLLLASDVQGGNLDIVLYSSDGTEVYRLDKAKEIVDYYTLKATDTYTLAAECSDFVGNYSVEIFKAD